MLTRGCSRTKSSKTLRSISTTHAKASTIQATGVRPPTEDHPPPFLKSNLQHLPRPPLTLYPLTPAFNSEGSERNPLKTFLALPPSYTWLPTPISRSSKLKLTEDPGLDSALQAHEFHFARSTHLDVLAVIDACLHGLHDVPRARGLFNRVRVDDKGHPTLSIGLYNAMLNAYLEKAADIQTEMVQSPRKARLEEQRRLYIGEFWSLYEVIHTEAENVTANGGTYALALFAYLRFGPSSEKPVADSMMRVPADILRSSIEKQVSIGEIVGHPSLQFKSSFLPKWDVSDIGSYDTDCEGDRRRDVVRLISRTALEMGNMDIVRELGTIEEVLHSDSESHPVTSGLSNENDPLHGVPEVKPVLRRNPNASKKKNTTEDGIDETIPFNLSLLRSRLQSTIQTRRLLEISLKAASESSSSSVQSIMEDSPLIPSAANSMKNPQVDLGSGKETSPSGSNLNTAQIRQTHLETLTYQIAETRLKHEREELVAIQKGGEMGMKGKMMRQWMWQWHCRLEERLKEDIPKLSGKGVRKPESKLLVTRDIPLHPFLTLLPPSTLSLLTIIELLRLQGAGGIEDGMKTTRAVLNIGHSLEEEHKLQLSRKVGLTDFQLYDNQAQQHAGMGASAGIFMPWRNYDDYRQLYARRVAMRRVQNVNEQWSGEWTQTVRASVGSYLVDQLMSVAEIEQKATNSNGEEITEMHPAFFHSYDYIRGRKLGVIRLHPAVLEQMTRQPVGESLKPRHLPMLVPPRPWTDHDQGGYLFNKSSAMRFKDSIEQKIYLREASQAGNLELLYAGLDVLGSTPWQINKRIFDVVLEVWNSGKGLAKVPPESLDLEEPVKPTEEDDVSMRNVYIERTKANYTARANNHSDRCNVNYKLEIARAFLTDNFYFPHNLDFRGRAYPLPPHLNHMGDDLSRGLLMFGEGKPLGEAGLRWLKIHLANLYGYDKASFNERVEWVDTHLEDVRDSALHPLDGERWWTKGDEPWQCLAACMELVNAFDSGDPISFSSALPVHQDGTCNGLQHYAALGGDIEGAKQVNLMDTDRPSDVYSHVAQAVGRLIEEDAAKGNPKAQACMNKISRKVVKQTVMTTVYGVTFVGAREQIQRQLRDRGDIPAEACWEIATYIAQKVLIAIGDLFSGANAIKSYLTLAARLISKSMPPERARALMDAAPVDQRTKYKQTAQEQMTSVIWTTPLGLPVVQPYRKTKRKQIRAAIQSLYISDPNDPAEVNSMKQSSAFPPNFIHSLDATHMMLTALECRAKNIMFASVHDSYWTHASTIDEMSTTIRDTFVALHSSDVLGKLHDEFNLRYKGYKIPLSAFKVPRLRELLESSGNLHDFIVNSKSRTAHEFMGKIAKGEIPPPPEADPILKSKAKRKRKSIEDTEDLEMVNPDSDMENTLEESPEDEGDEINDELSRRFIDLNTLFPLLPKKGDFDVQNIKRSQYFFS